MEISDIASEILARQQQAQQQQLAVYLTKQSAEAQKAALTAFVVAASAVTTYDASGTVSTSGKDHFNASA